MMHNGMNCDQLIATIYGPAVPMGPKRIMMLRMRYLRSVNDLLRSVLRRPP